jgi:putative flavoprotein involved in K+ transport
MDATGVWDERHDEIDDLTRARRLPSPQLRRPPPNAPRSDLNALTDLGVRAGGPVGGVARRPALFSGGLRNVFALADLKQRRLLDTFDAWARAHGADTGHRPSARSRRRVPATSRLELDLGSGEIRTVVWATGYRPDYSWLDVPVVDPKGHLRHEGGAVDSAGSTSSSPGAARRKSTSSTASRTTPARSSTTWSATSDESRRRGGAHAVAERVASPGRPRQAARARSRTV